MPAGNVVTQRPLLVVTPTHDRADRMAYLERCLSLFSQVSDLHWIVIEDAAAPSPDVAQLLAQSGISHEYLATGPTRRWGNAQRDLALRHIRDNGLQGVVYLADDDNWYQTQLFKELGRVKRVAILPVGLLGPWGIERPILRGGRIVGWRAHWKSRRFPVDMAGFAFDAALLPPIDGPIWTYGGRGGESEFLERLVTSADELEVLFDQGRRCYVWHDLPLGQSIFVALARYRVRRCITVLVEKFLRPFLIGPRKAGAQGEP